MKREVLERRTFLKQASLMVLTLPVFELGVGGLMGCSTQPALSKAEITDRPTGPWKIVTVSEKEPGEPLVISGTIYAPDGRTPMKSANLFVYQTDATGVYSTSGGDNRNTRIHGLMTTNADGRYEFRTIKPGSYPNSRNAAHIHAYVSAPGYPEYWIEEFVFSDDPYVAEDLKKKAAAQGSFAAVLTLKRGDDGVLRGARDIKIERCSRNCTGN